ncbi:MAG: hypothetical protein KatS3mg111_0324 [Pirellulaceae bacterium]|nr:MAG: hypothetical protein KatS3mg111_0324 [Pirellulaceae bacterium]
MTGYLSLFRLALIGLSTLSLLSAMQVPLAAQSLRSELPAQAMAILTKYCVGCHNDQEAEADLSLQSLLAGKEATMFRELVSPGLPEQSRLLQVITGEAEPRMPPEGESAPSAEEVAVLRHWIASGAKLEPPMPSLQQFVPLATAGAADRRFHQVAAACMVEGALLMGRLGRLERLELQTGTSTDWLGQLPGEVTALRPTADGKLVAVAVSVAGVGAEVLLIDAVHGTRRQTFSGHHDAVYALAISADGSMIASGGYDRQIIVWDVASATPRWRFTGHNGAIYDLDFHPTGKALASASADQTIKLWSIRRGERLDTFSQAEGEMTCVRFSPDGRFLFGGGYDRQLRQWRLVSLDQPAINPLVRSRFAHEGPIVGLALVNNDLLVSISEDRTIKLWESDQLGPAGVLAECRDVPVAIATERGSNAVIVVDLFGRRYELPRDNWPSRRPQQRAARQENRLPATEKAFDVTAEPATVFAEREPNDSPDEAQSIQLPATLQGIIGEGAPHKALVGDVDVDLYQFDAVAGQPWIFSVRAAVDGSSLDSLIDILDEAGQPVLRTRLQALRESYFTFRGKDADTSDDFRLHKWEEMELDEYLYSSGEVTRLWHYPRGPDSGFKVYPGYGQRHTFFDTTPIAHALGEPAYIVRPLAADEEPLPNGLPVFPLYFENDDDPLRRTGRDSRLTFVAPRDGRYLLRVRDARGFGGDDYRYTIDARRPAPDFKLKITGAKLRMAVGSGREWSVEAERIDGFDGAVAIDLVGLPDGFRATNPVIIEAGQQRAFGSVFATEQVGLSGEEGTMPVEVALIARAALGNRQVERELTEKLRIEVTDEPEVLVRLYTDEGLNEELQVLTIRPGHTTSAVVAVNRNGFEGRIEFGKDDSGRNLPHGTYVDNIGLNGLLITETQNAREFFITADAKTQPGRYQFHLRSSSKGNPTSPPVWLEVLAPSPQADR